MSIAACPPLLGSEALPGEEALPSSAIPLGSAPRGYRGRITGIVGGAHLSDLSEDELELRLLEFGMTEGAVVEILHEGAFGRDPIAVRVGGMTIALRRREAMTVLVTAC
ncbi:ferrous iron transport protein A [Jiella sp. M17.18]|uniref:FeoA family protein n=1 Tax=Jiella sp. M17.18 TaxID=3234247 RepID=UPI0034DF5790